MSDQPTQPTQHHEIRIRYHDGETRPTYIPLMVGAGGSHLGLTVRSYLDPEQPVTIIHAIDAQSMAGRLNTPAEVADYLEVLAKTIRQAHVISESTDRKAP